MELGGYDTKKMGRRLTQVRALLSPSSPAPARSSPDTGRPSAFADNGDSTANDSPVVIGDCNGSTSQVWAPEPDGAIEHNGKCLDIYRDEKTSKAPVELWTCTGAPNQQWQAKAGALVNPDSGKCLDDPRYNVTDGTQLEIYTCNGGANQQWRLPYGQAPGRQRPQHTGRILADRAEP